MHTCFKKWTKPFSLNLITTYLLALNFSQCTMYFPLAEKLMKRLWTGWLNDGPKGLTEWLADPHDSRFKPHRLGNVPRSCFFFFFWFFGQTQRRTFQFIAIFIAENFVRRFLCVVKWQRAKELEFSSFCSFFGELVNNALSTVQSDKKIINLASSKNISQLSYPGREWKLFPPRKTLATTVCLTLTVFSNSNSDLSCKSHSYFLCHCNLHFRLALYADSQITALNT